MSPTIIYPPTVPYDFMVQRPHHLLRAIARNGPRTIFVDQVVPHTKRSPGVYKVGHNYFLAHGSMPNLTPPIIMYYTFPNHIDVYPQILNPDFLLFDTLDIPQGVFNNWNYGYEKSLKLANMVIASSIGLYEKAKIVNPNSFYIPNGVDYEFFSKILNGTISPNQELMSLSRGKPIIGFYGAFGPWIDSKLIEYAAKRLNNCFFVIIGPPWGSQLPNAPNIHRIGYVHYYELPSFLAAFNVCLLPFKNCVESEYCNPVKLWEYMASGKPIVSINIKDLDPEYVYVVNNKTDFVEAIKVALKEDPINQVKRSNRAKENSWGYLGAKVIELLEKISGFELKGN